jgi:hypothetical protein
MSIEDEDVSTSSQYSGGYDEVGVTTGIGNTSGGGQGGDNTINANQFRLNGGPNSTVITRTKDQQQRFQTGEDRMDRMRAFGGGDYRNSPQYAEYLSTTGRSVKNPYGSSGVSGILGKIFGEENISSTLDPAQAQKVLDVGFDRYMNFDQQSDLARSRGFGSLFGGAVGEQLANNQTVAEQVLTPMSTSDMGARLGVTAMGLGPVLSMLPSTAGPNSNVNFISTGNPNYKEALDPNVNPALSSGIMGNIGKMLAGGVDLRDAGGRVMDLGRKGLDSLTERFGANNLEVPAGVMGNLSPAPDDYEESVGATSDTTGMFRAGDQFVSTSKYEPAFITQGTTPQLQQELTELANDDILRGRDLMADQITPAGLPISSPAPYEIQSSPMLDTLRGSDDLSFLSEQFTLTPSQMILNARELNQDVGLPGGNLKLEYNPDTNTKGIKYNVPINSLLQAFNIRT